MRRERIHALLLAVFFNELYQLFFIVRIFVLDTGLKEPSTEFIHGQVF